MRIDLYVLGVPFWNAGYEEFREWLDGVPAANVGRCTVVFIANAHTLNIAATDKAYADCLRQADALVNDGFGYRIAARVRGFKTLYNFNGTDLFPRMFAGLEKPLRVFLYGATEESNARTAKKVAERYPMVQIVGRIHGFGPEEEVVSQINASAPDLLLCALGQPKQELFLLRVRDRLNAKVVVGVGGLFDFLSGAKPRAPQYMRDWGFEWLFRLAHEPRRLFRRYVIGNPVFLVRCFVYLRRDKRLCADQRLRTSEAALQAPAEAERSPASKSAS